MRSPRDEESAGLTRDGSVSMRIDCRDAVRAAKAISHRWKPGALRQLISALQDQYCEAEADPRGQMISRDSPGSLL
jgi:hypothetical protein